MSGPAWVTGGFAALMIATAAYCAGRLAVARLRGRDTELDADGLHVLMGVAMAGMLEPRLTSVPGAAWRAVGSCPGRGARGADGGRSAWPGGFTAAHDSERLIRCPRMPQDALVNGGPAQSVFFRQTRPGYLFTRPGYW